MRARLTPYTGSESDSMTAIDVDLVRKGAKLDLRYAARGQIALLRLPAAKAAARADNLWQHTCFEAFIGASGAPDYCELNFSPSGEWAAYGFTRYREGMRNLEVAAPVIKMDPGPNNFELSVSLDTKALPHGAWRVALAAVIEETSGRKSYWALAHPGAKPDFHHPDSFILELPA
jgi:hypothetical protein